MSPNWTLTCRLPATSKVSSTETAEITATDKMSAARPRATRHRRGQRYRPAGQSPRLLGGSASLVGTCMLSALCAAAQCSAELAAPSN